jgi:hypothetical protein
VEVGSWRIFEVNSSTFRIIGDTVIENYQLREEIVDFFINVEKDTTWVLHRSILDPVTDLWELDSVWSVRRTPNHAIVVENNSAFVKIGFPVRDGLTWDGNVLNVKDEETYTIDGLGVELMTDTETFENVLKVVQSDVQDTIIRFDQRSEVYGLDIGLIRKKMLILNYCSTIDCLGDGIVESGIDFEMNLLDYGPK